MPGPHPGLPSLEGTLRSLQTQIDRLARRPEPAPTGGGGDVVYEGAVYYAASQSIPNGDVRTDLTMVGLSLPAGGGYAMNGDGVSIDIPTAPGVYALTTLCRMASVAGTDPGTFHLNLVAAAYPFAFSLLENGTPLAHAGSPLPSAAVACTAQFTLTSARAKLQVRHDGASAYNFEALLYVQRLA